MKTHINKKYLISLCVFLSASTYSMQRIPSSLQRLSITRQLAPQLMAPRMNNLAPRTFSTLPLKSNTTLVRPKAPMNQTMHERGNSTLLHVKQSRVINQAIKSTLTRSSSQNCFQMSLENCLRAGFSHLHFSYWNKLRKHPLGNAIIKNDLKFIGTIANNIDLNQNINGQHPLHLAQSPETIEALINGGADVNARNSSGKTLLHDASQAGDQEKIKLLINHKANVNIQDDNGWTPLHYAIANGGSYDHNGLNPIAKILLKAGATKNIKDFAGKTPFEVEVHKIESCGALGCDCNWKEIRECAWRRFQ